MKKGLMVALAAIAVTVSVAGCGMESCQMIM